jgi:hypothetical protein
MIGDGGLGSEARRGKLLGRGRGALGGGAVRGTYRRGARRVRVLRRLLDAVIGF